ncbi:hypothetical protein Acr_08g0007600 [Actinidia rufa]|uniref:Uncharacterized protein n=1 Tax=Actinidia rufa TaxID=165716 RepID=A0A7J0F106_9ERIC|nr:hypothetical protein Acr_08g0007600 [Actinidia rufa]
MLFRPDSSTTFYDLSILGSGSMHTSLPPVCRAAAAKAMVDEDASGVTSTMSFAFMPAAKTDMNSLLSGSAVVDVSQFSSSLLNINPIR